MPKRKFYLNDVTTPNKVWDLQPRLKLVALYLSSPVGQSRGCKLCLHLLGSTTDTNLLSPVGQYNWYTLAFTCWAVQLTHTCCHLLAVQLTHTCCHLLSSTIDTHLLSPVGSTIDTHLLSPVGQYNWHTLAVTCWQYNWHTRAVTCWAVQLTHTCCHLLGSTTNTYLLSPVWQYNWHYVTCYAVQLIHTCCVKLTIYVIT
jgi:hypothetical protein